MDRSRSCRLAVPLLLIAMLVTPLATTVTDAGQASASASQTSIVLTMRGDEMATDDDPADGFIRLTEATHARFFLTSDRLGMELHVASVQPAEPSSVTSHSLVVNGNEFVLLAGPDEVLVWDLSTNEALAPGQGTGHRDADAGIVRVELDLAYIGDAGLAAPYEVWAYANLAPTAMEARAAQGVSVDPLGIGLKGVRPATTHHVDRVPDHPADPPLATMMRTLAGLTDVLAGLVEQEVALLERHADELAAYAEYEPRARAPELGTDPDPPAAAEPHVIVGVPDSGIDPYHEAFYRPERTDHPCTYLENFPCDLPALELTLGTDDRAAALAGDEAVWASVEPDTWYWIPQTPFVAVSCFPPTTLLSVNDAGTCILDDTPIPMTDTVIAHGTSTTSSILSENPDALLAFKEGNSSLKPFFDRGLPVDLYSISWGNRVPLPLVGSTGSALKDHAPIMVKASGNEPGASILADHYSGSPYMITVGGGRSAPQPAQASLTYKEADLTSFYCRPTAEAGTVDGYGIHCGTSFAAPTVAGAMSLAMLELRRASGFTGHVRHGLVDAEMGLTIEAFRDAVNRTASYDPEPRYPDERPATTIRYPYVPLNPVAPWLQWGWGWYDATVVPATVDHLLGTGTAPEKPAEARLYMDSLYTGRQLLYGPPPET